MSVFLFWVHGEWIVVETNKSSENRFAVHAICLSRSPIHSQWTQKKDTHSLNIHAKTSFYMYYLVLRAAFKKHLSWHGEEMYEVKVIYEIKVTII